MQDLERQGSGYKAGRSICLFKFPNSCSWGQMNWKRVKIFLNCTIPWARPKHGSLNCQESTLSPIPPWHPDTWAGVELIMFFCLNYNICCSRYRELMQLLWIWLCQVSNMTISSFLQGKLLSSLLPISICVCRVPLIIHLSSLSYYSLSIFSFPTRCFRLHVQSSFDLEKAYDTVGDEKH